MHIVHIAGYFLPHLGGVEYRIKELSDMLIKRGHTVEIFTSDIDCATGKISSSKNFRIHYLKSIEFAHSPVSPTLFFRLLFLPRNCVIHLHIAHAFIPEITYLVCKIRRLPYVATVHLDVTPSGFLGFLLPLYKKFFLTRVLRNAQAVTVLTQDYRQLVSKKYAIPQSNVIVIPNGTRFTASPGRRQRLHAPIQLLFVGRLSVQKNIPLLIEAVHICINRHKFDVRLRIAGSGEKEGEIKNLIRKYGLEKHVIMLGAVSVQKVSGLYQSSDIFILPSLAESFGTVLIEAMASGTPVIATNILGVRNIVKDGYNGFLVDQNAQDVARAIARLIKNSALRQKLIRNGLKEVKNYNWDNVTDQFEALYRNVLRKTNV